MQIYSAIRARRPRVRSVGRPVRLISGDLRPATGHSAREKPRRIEDISRGTGNSRRNYVTRGNVWNVEEFSFPVEGERNLFSSSLYLAPGVARVNVISPAIQLILHRHSRVALAGL